MADAPSWARQDGEGVLLELHVQPGARRSAVIGEHGGRLKLAIASPPVDGRANEALIAFLADRLRLRKSELALVSGEASRVKRVRIAARLAVGDVVATLYK
jgi:uncharacterized protein (TIGR00251 family)